MEFLVRMTITFPPEMPAADKRALQDAEAEVAGKLRADGKIVRIWRVPGRTANVGIWAAPDATALHDAITTLPLFPYITAEVEALAVHYLEA